MPPASWLTAARRALPPGSDWTEADLGRYWRDGFTPEEAAADVQFREVARS